MEQEITRGFLSEHGACQDKEVDPYIFFEHHNESAQARKDRVKAAKEICRARCVREECLEYALQKPENYNIWGGMDEEERRKLEKVRSQSPNNASDSGYQTAV
jgi:WhiB family redox-sensing transcriptional regulator